MIALVIIFFGFVTQISTLTELEIDAEAFLPQDGSAATAQGFGVGANVVGDAIVKVDEDEAFSSVVIQAYGTSKPGPKPGPKPKPKPTPKPKPRPTPKPTPKFKKPTPKTAPKKPVCTDIKDKQCPAIDKFNNCGFCVQQKYPTKGYACLYEEKYVLKGDSKKVGGEYEKILTPLCKCDGNFILKGKDCPSCEKLLTLILKCAGSDKKTGDIKIPERCLKELKVTEKILKECGFLGSPPKKLASSSDKKPVVIVEQKKPVLFIEPKKVTETVFVPFGGYATAAASAAAVSGASSAYSTSFSSGVVADAVATAAAGN